MSIANIISRWPSVDDLAADIGVRPVTIYSWRRRGYLPAKNIPSVHNAAKNRGFSDITLSSLVAASMQSTDSAAPDAYSLHKSTEQAPTDNSPENTTPKGNSVENSGEAA